MNIEKKQQARNLFFQTELTKSQIATLLGISRRSLTYWIKEGSWQRLKKSAAHLPAILAENCYHLIGNLTEHYLSERRLTNPVSSKEVSMPCISSLSRSVSCGTALRSTKVWRCSASL